MKKISHIYNTVYIYSFQIQCHSQQARKLQKGKILYLFAFLPHETVTEDMRQAHIENIPPTLRLTAWQCTFSEIIFVINRNHIVIDFDTAADSR